MAKFTVEFTETVHRNIQIEAADEQEATDWVNENWEEACALDSEPMVSCDINHCYPST
jgi:hypothetical protein